MRQAEHWYRIPASYETIISQAKNVTVWSNAWPGLAVFPCNCMVTFLDSSRCSGANQVVGTLWTLRAALCFLNMPFWSVVSYCYSFARFPGSRSSHRRQPENCFASPLHLENVTLFSEWDWGGQQKDRYKQFVTIELQREKRNSVAELEAWSWIKMLLSWGTAQWRKKVTGRNHSIENFD